MKRLKQITNQQFIGILLLFFILSNTVHAKQDIAIPEPLKPWQDWVLHDVKDHDCPFLYSNSQQRFCAWPARLTLNLNQSGGQFEQRWQVYKKSWVRLPGNVRYWPQSVKIDNKNAIVTQQQDYPVVELGPGTVKITGEFDWDQLPESLPIEPGTALVKLTVNGKSVTNPPIEQEGRLWLSDSRVKPPDAVQRDDVLTINVYRRLTDEVPFVVTTRLDINASGDQREVLLGKVLIDNSIPTDLQSQLPARLEPNGGLRMQVRPGRWHVIISARFVNAVNELRMPVASPPLPEQETWVFDARSYLRVVEISGVTSIDPGQTNLPSEWKSLPAYLVKPENGFELKQVRRGNPEPEPNQLQLQRTLWLDFDGGGYTMRDNITGTMRRGWRLDASEELQLGRVVVNGQPQLITTLEGSSIKGVEVRQGELQLEADSRYEKSRHDLPVGGWLENFQNIETTLNLPPGWRLFSADGVDNTPNTWLQSWTLLDFFMVLILSMAVFRLWSWYWGIIALITFTLIWHEPGNAPRYIWINVFVAIALLRVVPHNTLRKFVMAYRNFSLLALIIITVPFMVDEVRHGIYPQLEKPQQTFFEQPQVLMQPAMEMKELSRPRIAPLASAPFSMAEEPLKRKAEAAVSDELAKLVDPNATVQTGPGLPDWQWNSVYLSWTGPSDQQQRTQLILLSPATNMLLNLLRVGFLLLLCGLVFEFGRGKISARKAAPAALMFSVLFCAILFTASGETQAAFPDDKLLNELKQRLTKAPDCLPHCAAVATLDIDIGSTRLNLASTIHAHQRVAVPLAARADQWMPDTVSLNGNPVQALFRSDDGVLWVAVGPGIHVLSLSGNVPDRSYFQLPLLLKPNRVEVKSKGWTVEGVSAGGVPDSQIQFSRIQKQLQNQEYTQLQAGPLPPFVRVERTLKLGLEWQVVTSIHRISTSSVPIVFELPLVSGESVLDDKIKVRDGRALVSLSSKQNHLAWTSRLNQQPTLQLNAEKTSDWIEVWRLDVSPIWHVASSGIPVIHHQGDDKHWMPEWHPYPGESIALAITRPAAVSGKSLTIDRSHFLITPGSRMTESTLSFTVRSSQGAQHTLILPADATLSAVYIDEVIQPIRQEGRRVALPVNPGEHQFKLDWRLAEGISNYYISQDVEIGLGSVNNSIQLILPQDRWVLLTAGPRLGPAVLYWGVVIIVLIISGVLSFIKVTPLRYWHWALLGIGLSQVHVIFALIVVGWLLLFGVRQKLVSQAGNILFNFVQTGLAVLTVVALLVLFYAIQQGLLGQPDMQIAGNGSTAYELNWYQDQVLETLPNVWVLSVPLSIYRLLMLLWALWLAYAVLAWLRWAWRQYGIEGYWRKPEKKQKPDAEPPGGSSAEASPGTPADTKAGEKKESQKPDPWLE
ncbi:MAG: hypothetical protein L0Z73_07605 [Gammaproteobacteria bacterium]|nr:hypothetical protein [Gammaproteobacteria bacterium]